MVGPLVEFGQIYLELATKVKQMQYLRIQLSPRATSIAETEILLNS